MLILVSISETRVLKTTMLCCLVDSRYSTLCTEEYENLCKDYEVPFFLAKKTIIMACTENIGVIRNVDCGWQHGLRLGI